MNMIAITDRYIHQIFRLNHRILPSEEKNGSCIFSELLIAMIYPPKPLTAP
ncbi:MAG: hypothetical protein IJ598_02170 [Ruminococcus sp.]|nr:hypothetical protein [Ruminococcus sp.]